MTFLLTWSAIMLVAMLLEHANIGGDLPLILAGIAIFGGFAFVATAILTEWLIIVVKLLF